ncbi:hypothetical protein QFC21_002865 [Naganishia friedmannii]|uniref:Uncharacterized protein n=1 Tax=Naganishia friedmannii TaxID=89922 RepID=A0ACC2VUC8_9TREE|nr:hypothetical protein QFC21_002865 [Naganishia friedmannii]
MSQAGQSYGGSGYGGGGAGGAAGGMPGGRPMHQQAQKFKYICAGECFVPGPSARVLCAHSWTMPTLQPPSGNHRIINQWRKLIRRVQWGERDQAERTYSVQGVWSSNHVQAKNSKE